MLEELTDPAGGLLWRALRDVMLWASVPPQEREGTLLPGVARERKAELRAADVDPALQVLLRTVLDAVASTSVSPETVTHACQQISQWADAQGKLGTALAFAQAAALAVPTQARAAYTVGRIARRHGEHARAESWFDQAITRGQASGDWTTYALALIGMGNLHRLRGNLREAGRLHTQALNTARKHGLQEIQAMASHDLFVLAQESHRVAQAESYAIDALRAYGTGHPRLPSLAHDVACFWMDIGEFACALPVLRTVLSHIHLPRERLLTLGSIARASGGAGDASGFEEAWQRIWEATDEPVEGAAQAVLALAQGAVSLGDRVRAERAGERALALAAHAGESQVQLRAGEIREGVEKGCAAVVSHRRSAEAAERMRELASEFVTYLTV